MALVDAKIDVIFPYWHDPLSVTQGEGGLELGWAMEFSLNSGSVFSRGRGCARIAEIAHRLQHGICDSRQLLKLFVIL